MVAFSLSANNIGGGRTTGLAQAFGDWGLSAVWYVLAASIAMIPPGLLRSQDPQESMAVTIPEVVGRRFVRFSSNFTGPVRTVAVLPDLLPDRRLRNRHQLP